jgi:hypothetical protein
MSYDKIDVLVLPPRKYLRDCFTYNRRTGELWWNERPLSHFIDKSYQDRWNNRYAGKIAGYRSGRYWVVNINKQLYYASRIVWKLMKGVDPHDTVDHKNGNGTDNRLFNLRIASQLEQKWNTRRRVKETVSGVKGVNVHRGRLRVRIKDKGVEKHLGYFGLSELAAAAAAYEVAARNLHGSFYREQANVI